MTPGAKVYDSRIPEPSLPDKQILWNLDFAFVHGIWCPRLAPWISVPASQRENKNQMMEGEREMEMKMGRATW